MPLNPFRKRNREPRTKKPKYAEGGPIQGPGAPDDDTIPALLIGGCTYYFDWHRTEHNGDDDE